MPRMQRPVKPRHDPLHVELEADSTLKQYGRVSKPGRRKARDEDEQDNTEAVSSNFSIPCWISVSLWIYARRDYLRGIGRRGREDESKDSRSSS